MSTLVAEIAGMPQVKSGTLRLWGDWFGKPYDNVHRVVGCTVEDAALVFRFDGGEKLLVMSPQGVRVSEQHFCIRDAAKVRWEWFYYGRPQTADNLYFMEYVRVGDSIEGSTNTDWYKHEFKTSSSALAVEIL